jgi:hypothetical protein
MKLMTLIYHYLSGFCLVVFFVLRLVSLREWPGISKLPPAKLEPPAGFGGRRSRLSQEEQLRLAL